MNAWIICTSSVIIAASVYVFVKSNSNSKKELGMDFENLAPETSKQKPESKRVHYPGGKVKVFFGSQTGTAEGFGQILVNEGKKYGFDTSLVDLEEFEDDLSEIAMAIFVMATYGEGEPTDNATRFVDYLKETQELSDFSFTVFGLGNRQYEHYNGIAKLVDRKLEKYGANRVYKYGDGDDDGTLEEDFEAWKEDLWISLKKHFHVENEDMVEISKSSMLKFECVKDTSKSGVKVFSEQEYQHSNRHYFTAEKCKVIVQKELRQNLDFGSTIHVELELKNTKVEYVTADNLAILPENDPDMVNVLIDQMGYDGEMRFGLKPLDDKWKAPFPYPCTVQHALTNYVDIGNAPRRNVLGTLAEYAKDEEDKRRLQYLASKEGVDEYHSWVAESHRTFVDIVRAFSSIRIPLSDLFHILPSLQPRYYTISSSNQVHPRTVHATVSVIKEFKDHERSFSGVCSNYLARLKPENSSRSKKKNRPNRHSGEQGVHNPRTWPSAYVFVRASTFRLPKDFSVPIVMIGPGTGIAPMRAFLQERHFQIKNGQTLGPATLYFGCRHANSDYIYQDELQMYLASGALTHLHTAFSRDQQHKVYVQHVMEQHDDVLWDTLEHQTGYFYVCGATTMGKDVHKVLETIISKNNATIPPHDYLDKMHHEGRYVQELWS